MIHPDAAQSRWRHSAAHYRQAPGWAPVATNLHSHHISANVTVYTTTSTALTIRNRIKARPERSTASSNARSIHANAKSFREATEKSDPHSQKPRSVAISATVRVVGSANASVRPAAGDGYLGRRRSRRTWGRGTWFQREG